MLPARFFFQEHLHGGNRWSLCAAEICYANALLGAFFQSGKTLPIQVGQRRWRGGRWWLLPLLPQRWWGGRSCCLLLPTTFCQQHAISAAAQAKKLSHLVLPPTLPPTLFRLQRGGGPDQPIMRTVAGEVARGRWVHIFPEGKVNYTGQLGPLRWGVGKLVCDAAGHAGRWVGGWWVQVATSVKALPALQ